MKLMIVSGSHVPNSQSARTAAHLKQRAIALGLCQADEVQIQDLGSQPLPFWDFSQKSSSNPFGDFLLSCDALVLISPDWHGMATPAIKNWFYYLPAAALEHKPVLLCGVSAGDGGVYPVLDMRSYSFKNFRPCYLPDQLIVRQVTGEFNGQGVTPSQTEQRVDYCLSLLASYAAGFTLIRSQLPHRDAAFSYGI